MPGAQLLLQHFPTEIIKQNSEFLDFDIMAIGLVTQLSSERYTGISYLVVSINTHTRTHTHTHTLSKKGSNALSWKYPMCIYESMPATSSH